MNSRSRLACLLAAIMSICGTLAIEVPALAQSLPLVYSTDFEKGAEDWEFIDHGWKVKQSVEAGTEKATKVLSQFKKNTDYKPAVRSPGHIALLKNSSVTDFQLDVSVLSTHEDYNHRDACLFFGYQNPSQFYYVHLGKNTDDHANQIFIVNNAARTKISTQTTKGTDWDEKWHQVRITRNVEYGEINVCSDSRMAVVPIDSQSTLLVNSLG